MDRKGKVWVIVGARGYGKSTFTKNATRRVHDTRFRCYDVNGEYFGDDEALPDMDDFLEEMNGLTDMCMVFEEGTVFFSNRGTSKPMRKLLVAARHDRNQIFVIFHSIRSLPHYICDLADYVVVFSTNDTEDLVQTRQPRLLDAWKKVRGIKYKYEIVDLNKAA